MNADEKAVAECPFCGGAVVSHGSAPFGKVWAACDRCAASGPEIEGLSCEEAIAAFTHPKRLRAQHEAEMAALVAAVTRVDTAIESAIRIHSDDTMKPWDRHNLCLFLDGLRYELRKFTSIDAAQKEKA